MKLYGGIDLHSNNHVLVLIDEQDKIVYQKRLPNALDSTLSVLKYYRKRIVSLAVESTCNGYWLGLVPKQFGTGGKITLGGISKRGSTYLRTLLIHGARTLMRWLNKHDDDFSQCAKQLIVRRGKHKAIVAMANKTARHVWVAMTKGIDCVPPCHLSA